MFTFLIGNNNPYFDRKLRVKAQHKKLDNIEISLKKKIDRVKKFNALSCYYSSEDEEDMNANDAKESEELNNKENKNNNNNKSNDAFDKIQRYKYLMKILDIIISGILILGVLLSFIENDNFYEFNKDARVYTIQLMNFMISYPGDHMNYTLMSNISEFQEFLNITEIPIEFVSNITDLSNIDLELIIPDSSQILRAFILVTSVIGSIIILI
jgi:hypothetical protein